jgi:NADH-quinone oxidoreductase subunit L
MQPQFLKELIIIILIMPLIVAAVQYQFTIIFSRRFINSITIGLLGVSFGLSSYILYGFIIEHWQAAEVILYTWGQLAGKTITLGLLIDTLNTLMLTVVNCISLLVHIYSMHYMRHEISYSRFFIYIALFTFAMLLLVVTNNFLQLFFAWELVGLTSYLLIGFWFTKEAAVSAAFKAFLINRVSDLGLLLGILVIFCCYQSFNYNEIFSSAVLTENTQIVVIATGIALPTIDVICILLLIGALGKSAQMPFHSWLPDSMLGPLPVSALIHAATMVTAGIFMLARVMPLFIHSQLALNLMLGIGIVNCVAMGLMALVQYDVKQILAYSTISQLGLMLVALGSSATLAAITHLVTHAFFKALLFLVVGVVIVVCNNQQDLRKMGGLRKQMPFIYWIMLFASLAAIGVPGFSGFYSKELILSAINKPFINYLVLSSVFITAAYTLRMFFLIFYGVGKVNKIDFKDIPRSWLINIPLLILTLPVIALGWFSPEAGSKMAHGFMSLPFLLIVLGGIITWLCYVHSSQLTVILTKVFMPILFVLKNKYWFEKLNSTIVYFNKLLGNCCFQVVDKFILEYLIINSGVKCINKISNAVRTIQTGYLYHYLLIMLIGVLLLLLLKFPAPLGTW